MQAKVLANTLHMDRKAWLEARKQGLGGSDVATIAGLSKWKSQVQVFLEKTQAIEQEDVQSEVVFWECTRGSGRPGVCQTYRAKGTAPKCHLTAPRVSLDACKRGQAHRGRKNWIRMQNSI